MKKKNLKVRKKLKGKKKIAQLEAKLASGKIDQEEYDTKLAEIQTKLAETHVKIVEETNENLTKCKY